MENSLRLSYILVWWSFLKRFAYTWMIRSIKDTDNCPIPIQPPLTVVKTCLNSQCCGVWVSLVRISDSQRGMQHPGSSRLNHSKGTLGISTQLSAIRADYSRKLASDPWDRSVPIHRQQIVWKALINGEDTTRYGLLVSSSASFSASPTFFYCWKQTSG